MAVAPPTSRHPASHGADRGGSLRSELAVVAVPRSEWTARCHAAPGHDPPGAVASRGSLRRTKRRCVRAGHPRIHSRQQLLFRSNVGPPFESQRSDFLEAYSAGHSALLSGADLALSAALFERIRTNRTAVR